MIVRTELEIKRLAGRTEVIGPESLGEAPVAPVQALSVVTLASAFL